MPNRWWVGDRALLSYLRGAAESSRTLITLACEHGHTRRKGFRKEAIIGICIQVIRCSWNGDFRRISLNSKTKRVVIFFAGLREPIAFWEQCIPVSVFNQSSIHFAVAIGIGMLTSMQIIIPDRPNLLLGTFPTVMIPAFAVPSSICLHVISIRQLWRLGRKVDRDARRTA